MRQIYTEPVLNKDTSHIFFHIAIIVLSASIALTLPYSLSFLAKKLLLVWSVIENEEIFMVALEITVAILLIAGFQNTEKNRVNKTLSGFARNAGLLSVSAPRRNRMRKQTRKLKNEYGRARDIRIIGSTGAGTFVRPDSDLHEVLKNCRKAEIMLLDPQSEGAEVRAATINAPHITRERFSEQIMESIRFLKTLSDHQKDIRLKLYPDPPLLKMAVLGDIISVRSYPPGIDAGGMPEYVWKHDAENQSMYHLFLQYFQTRWNDSRIPEYDLRTDTLIYRDGSGKEIEKRSLSSSEGYPEDPVHPGTALSYYSD